MRKIFSAILAGVMVINLIACSSGDSSKSLEPPDLSGQWKQVNSESEDSYQGAIIEDDVIEIYWVSNNGDTRSLYWSGSFVKPDTSEEPYTWDSKNNKARTEFSLMASNDDIKTFTYEGGQISYSSSIMGTTSKIRLEKEEWEPGLKIEKVVPLDLSGQWEQVNEGFEGVHHVAIISGDTIEVYRLGSDNNTYLLFWSGTFVSPESNEEQYSWTSQQNVEKNELSLVASRDQTKLFKYEDNQISYPVTRGETTITFQLERNEWAPNLNNGDFYETSSFPFSTTGIEFSLPSGWKDQEDNSFLFDESIQGSLIFVEEEFSVTQEEFSLNKDILVEEYMNIPPVSSPKILYSKDISVANFPAKSFAFTAINNHDIKCTIYIVLVCNTNEDKLLDIIFTTPSTNDYTKYFSQIIESAKLVPQNNPDTNTAPSSSNTQAIESTGYSTNDLETAKEGNSGVFAYKNSVRKEYDLYWIIDFDEGYVYRFTEGNGESTCDRLKIDSGDLNSVLIITYHDGNDSWSYGLHFKWKNQPDTLILQEQNGYETKFATTDLDDALAIRETKNIIDY